MMVPLGLNNSKEKIGSVASKDHNFRKISLKVFVPIKYHRKMQMLPENTSPLDFIHWNVSVISFEHKISI